MSGDLGLYTQRRRNTVRDVIREQHGTPTSLREERYGTDPEAERRPPLCPICSMPDNTDHELRVVGPVRADGSDAKADEWRDAAARMQRRQGGFHDASLYSDEFLHREIEILAARVWHWEDAKREGVGA